MAIAGEIGKRLELSCFACDDGSRLSRSELAEHFKQTHHFQDKSRQNQPTDDKTVRADGQSYGKLLAEVFATVQVIQATAGLEEAMAALTDCANLPLPRESDRPIDTSHTKTDAATGVLSGAAEGTEAAGQREEEAVSSAQPTVQSQTPPQSFKELKLCLGRAEEEPGLAKFFAEVPLAAHSVQDKATGKKTKRTMPKNENAKKRGRPKKTQSKVKSGDVGAAPVRADERPAGKHIPSSGGAGAKSTSSHKGLLTTEEKTVGLSTPKKRGRPRKTQPCPALASQKDVWRGAKKRKWCLPSVAQMVREDERRWANALSTRPDNDDYFAQHPMTPTSKLPPIPKGALSPGPLSPGALGPVRMSKSRFWVPKMVTPQATPESLNFRSPLLTQADKKKEQRLIQKRMRDLLMQKGGREAAGVSRALPTAPSRAKSARIFQEATAEIQHALVPPPTEDNDDDSDISK